MSTTTVGPDSVLVPASGVHVVTVDDEKVLFVPDRATLHHLDPVAAVVWDCLLPPAPVADLTADLAEGFGADPATVERDVLSLLEQLVASGAVVDVEDLPRDTQCPDDLDRIA